MPDNHFSIHQFVRDCVGKPLPDMIFNAEKEVRRVEAISHGVKGSVANRKAGSTTYVADLKSLLAFLHFGTKPMIGPFMEFYPVAKSLVDSEEFPEDVLELFQD